MILQIGKEEGEQEKIMHFWLERTISGSVLLQSGEHNSIVEYTEAIVRPEGTIELVRFGKLDHVNNEAAYTKDDIKTVVAYLVHNYIEFDYDDAEVLVKALLPDAINAIKRSKHNENT